MLAKPLAVNLFTVRRALIEDFVGTLERIAELGYLGVEPMIFGPVPLELLPEDLRVPTPAPDRFREILDRLGLVVSSLHAPLPEGDGASAVFDFAEALGTDQLVLASFLGLPGLAGAHADAHLLREAVSRFNRASEHAAERGCALGFHNHHFEWEADLDGRYAWDLFWEGVDPRVNAEIDVYWAQTAGQDPATVISTLGARVRRVHLKDGPCVLGEPQVAVGSGTVDVESCVVAAKHADWHIVELDECASDVFEALGESARFLTERGWSRGREG